MSKIVSTVIHVRLMAWRNKLKSCKTLKKDISKELLPVAWHRTGCWNCCMSENEKRVIGSIFTDKVGKW